MNNRYRNIGILLFILLFGFLIRTPFFSVPLERDEGMHATVGQVILNGGLPYKDTVTFRAPGTYYTNALILKLFGQTAEALRIGSAIFALLTILVIFVFATRLYGESIGLLASFLYALFSSGPLIQGSLANAETFMMLPAVTATYVFYLGHKGQKGGYFLLAGILAGWAYLVKEATLPNFLLFYLFLLLTQKELFKVSGMRQILSRYLLLSAGFAIPIAAMFTYLAVNGALSHYLIGIYNWNTNYGDYRLDVFWARLRDRGIYSLGREYSFLWIASLISFIVMAIRGRNRDNAYVFLWVIFSFIGVCLGSMFWPHYFIQMIPSLSIAAAFGLNKVYHGLLSKHILVKVVSLTTAILFLFTIGYAIKTDYKFYFIYTPDEISKGIYGSDIFVNTKIIAAYVKDRTKPSDFIYQNRWETEIYFLANRRSPTKFLVHDSILVIGVTAIEELRNDIFYREPKYIIWYHPRPDEIPKFVVEPIINMKYELETEIGGVKIYRLKGWNGRDSGNA